MYDAFARHGATAKILPQDHDRLAAQGLSINEVEEASRIVADWQESYSNFGADYDPERNTIGPKGEYFIEVLKREGFPVSAQSIELARRNWMRAQSETLKDTPRRYGIEHAAQAIYNNLYPRQAEPIIFPAGTPAAPAAEPLPATPADKRDPVAEEAKMKQLRIESGMKLEPLPPPPLPEPPAPPQWQIIDPLPEEPGPEREKFVFTLSPLAEAQLEKLEAEARAADAAEVKVREERRQRYLDTMSQAQKPQAVVQEPKAATSPMVRSEPETPPTPDKDAAPDNAFRDLVANLIKARSKSGEWDGKSAAQHESVAELFLKYLENDNPARITQAQVGGFRSMLDDLPKSHGKSARDRKLPLKAILDKAKRLPADKVGLSPPTINRYLTQLGTTLKFARANGFDVADIDMATIKDMRPKDKEADEDKRSAFTTADLETLFRHAVWINPEQTKPQPSLYWIPLLGLYGLGRLSELCGLMVDDIDTDAKHPALLIKGNAARRVKTKRSVRRVPLHPELVRLGFLDYVASLKADKLKLLFADLRERGEKTGLGPLFDKKWTKLLDEALPQARAQLKTFHSFRKTGNTAMLNGEVIDAIRNEIMGHTQKDVNTRHYKAELRDEAKVKALSHLPVVTAHLVPIA